MGYDEFDSDSPSSNPSRMSGKKLTALINEQDIGKAVSDWTCDYNKKHAGK